MGMGSVNTAEQRMSYTANLLYAQAPPNTSATVYSTLIRQASQCLHSKIYRLFACIPLTCEWLGNPSQIEPQKVEFWSVSKKEMERKEQRCYLFPPQFIISVNGKRAMTEKDTAQELNGSTPENSTVVGFQSHSQAHTVCWAEDGNKASRFPLQN